MANVRSVHTRACEPAKEKWTLGRGGLLLVLFTVGLTGMIRWSINPFLQEALPLVVFVIPVVICAMLGGTRLGVLATLMSVCVGIYFFMNPILQFEGSLSAVNAERIVSFTIAGLVVSVLSGRMHRQIVRLTGAEQTVAAREITLRQMHSELERRTAELESFIEHAPIGFGLIDREKRYIRVNEAMARMNGVSVEAHAGLPVASVTPPHFAQEVEKVLQHCFDTGEALVGMECTSELPKNAGGKRDLLVTVFPVRDSHGIVAVGGITLDITERKRAEEALRESDMRLRLALEAAFAGSWDWDIGRDKLTWSEINYALYGRDPIMDPVLKFRNWLASVIPEEQTLVQASIERVLAPASDNDDNVRIEFRIEHPQLGERWLLALGRVLRDEQGQAIRLLGINIDITDRRNIEESERVARAEAERLNRLKDDFVATISHELRTPLTAILGWVQILQRPARENDKIDRGLEVIERNARLLTQIVSDLLDVGRIASGKMRLETSPIDLGAVTRGALETVRSIASAKGVKLHVDIAQINEPLLGDAARIQQIVWNLVSNAIKFTPRGGIVEVRVEARHEWAAISVRDTGQGIAAEFLPHLFERFRQEDSSSSRKYGGLGLGLAIVKHLTELHGGRVIAESAGIGCGSTFRVELPLAPYADRYTFAPNLRTLPHAGGTTLGGVRVLVVEDEPDTREFVQRVLEESSAEVVSAASAVEALGIFELARPDVLVSDIGMPGMDGYALIRAIRARRNLEESHSPLPAVALTAFARREDRERALEAGYAEHLTKPIDPGKLVATVARLCREANGAAIKE